MRWLALALWLTAGSARADTNTVAFWTLDNVLTDSSLNGYTLTDSGSVAFTTSPAPPTGTYCAGTFTTTKRLTSTAARTALSGSTAYTIEGYFYTTSVATQQLFLSAGATNASSICLSINTSKYKLIFDDARVYETAAGAISINTWYYFALVVNGTSVKGYLGTVGETPTKVIDTTDASPESPTAGEYALGNYTLSYGFMPAASTYLSNVRLSNVARTTLPSWTDVPASVLSPYSSQGLSPFVSPWRMLK